MNDHIELFHPTISHYRLEHAPNIRYLPSDINIKLMHEDFNEKCPDIQISYEFYRLKLKEKTFHLQFSATRNVKYVKLSNFMSTLMKICNQIVKFVLQIFNIHVARRYKNARDLYQQHAKTSSQPTNDSNNIVLNYSADLQKVIMLPRVNTFKKVIFVRRLTTYKYLGNLLTTMKLLFHLVKKAN